MPRYFFDIDENGIDFRDDEGTDLRGLKEAQNDAVQTLLGMAQSYAGRDNEISMSADIRDETGSLVAKVNLAVKVS